MNTAEASAADFVLRTGELLVSAATVAGVAVFLRYMFSCLRNRPRAVCLITDDWLTFAAQSVPYALNFIVCWHLSLTFGRLAASSRLISNVASRHHVAFKTTLNVAAAVTKYYLFCAPSRLFRGGLLVGHLGLAAAAEAMCNERYDRATVDATLALLFWLTALVLIAPATAYQNLILGEMITWKRCSLMYGLVTGVCYSLLKSDGKDNVFDAVLMVLVVHVQLVFLCVTYFSDGQQVLRNVAGLGTYNPMADTLDIYFTVDSIMFRMNALKSIHGL